MARRLDVPGRRPPLVALGAIGLLVVIVLGGAVILLANRGPGALRSPQPSQSAGRSLVADSSPAPSGTTHKSAVPSPVASPTVGQTSEPTPSPHESQTPEVTQVPTASQTPAASAAPTSQDGFDLHGQIIDMGFPLRADTNYRYRDNWLDPRAGPPDPYNHAKPGPHGQLIRLHDGIDMFAAEGEPVLAPFSGTVIDPATKWAPWHADRYGLTVVIVSDEPAAGGYAAIMVHLERVWVDIGQHVSRGQVIGALGRTGDAENVAPQLHFELRAPFLIDWSALGENRMVDAFNPYPSLVAADPKR